MHDEYPEKRDVELRSTLALFLFGADDIDKPISTLSGGERARLTLAKLILKKVNLLIMDEPTNHLDIGSCEALENALQAFEGTIIAVSHDRYFINSLATRIIEFDKTRHSGIFDYELNEEDDAFAEYLNMRAMVKQANAESVAVQKPVSTSKEEFEAKKREKQKKQSEERKIIKANEKIKELEAELERLDEELFGDAASDYVRAAEIDKRKCEIEEELMELYEIVM
jgi:ATP-binding cassette subfamily F protein 3